LKVFGEGERGVAGANPSATLMIKAATRAKEKMG